MHVVDVTLFHTASSGGVRRYLEAKHRALRPRHQHTVLVPGAKRIRRKGMWQVPAMGVPWGAGYRFPVLIKEWTQALQTLRPDLIEAGDPYRLAWAALKAGQQLGVPVVGFYHSDLVRMAEVRLGSGARRLAERYLYGLYRHFDLVLAPSQVMLERLRALGVPRLALQPLGVDPRVFHPHHRDPEFRTRLGLAPDIRLLLFVGRAAPEKNIPLLLRAMRRLGPGYHLLLVGPGMPPVSSAGITVWPRFVRGQLPTIMASADAFVHAGDQETFGLVVLEAMASAIPVVGVAGGAVPELLHPEYGELAPPGDADAFADAVRRLCAGDLDAAGRAARLVVQRRYAWDRAMRTLERQYLCLHRGEESLPVGANAPI